MEVDFTDLTAVLTWLVFGGGALVLANWFASWVLANLTFWKNLTARVKSLIVMGIAVVFAVAAQALLQFPEAIAEIAPWFKIIGGLIIGWLAGQLAYRKEASAGLYG